jgi:hypothetical protein
MRDFAARLIACEARENSTFPGVRSTFPVYEKLRPQLATLMGSTGVRALYMRALARANAEAPWLHAVHVNADDSLEGLSELEAQMAPDQVFEGRVALVAQLLELLVAFIGENLTQRLVREVWPEVSLDDLHVGQ